MSKKGCDKTPEERAKDREYRKTYYRKHKDEIRKYDRNKPSNLRRIRNMERLRMEKGNKCSLCGYDEEPRILHFHHLRDKEFGISDYGISYEKAKKEAEKCVLLCPNCHHIIHLK